MMRALYSAISGLKSHQTRMDVVGSNIANVNTVGFKSSRLNFENAMSQSLTSASSPTDDDTGGTNPVQVGLGTQVSSIDTLFTQGGFESTGVTTDVAITGNAFFVVSDGDQTYYTRDGSFDLDAAGHLVSSSSGLILQGLNADDDGTIDSSAKVDDIVIPYNTQSPAQATTEVTFARNLNSDAYAKGTVTYSERYLTYADGGEDLEGVYDADGTSLGIQTGDVLTFSATDSSGNAVSSTYTVADGDSLGDVLSAMQTFLSGSAGSTGATVALQADGSVAITAGSTSIRNFQVSSSRPISTSTVANAFAVESTIAAGDTDTTDALLEPVTSSTLLADTLDSQGRSLGLETGDQISIAGAVGGVIDSASTLSYDATTTTMGDLLTAIQDQLGLPSTDGTSDENPTVSINGSATDDNIPDGSIVIRGLAETAFEISDLSITASNSDSDSTTPAYFNANMDFTEFQEATDTEEVATSLTVYDSNGTEHVLSVTFTPTGEDGVWLWNADVAGSESIVSGGSGTVTFGTDGTVSSFAFTDGSSKVTIDPGNGAQVMEIALDPGGPGEYSGLTQYDSASTAAATGQDGHTMGNLSTIAIGSDGVIEGTFDNGETMTLAQILVADFTNPGGLENTSGTLYAETVNSGEAVLGIPGSGSTSTLTSGELEMSNVDLSEEFTSMITTQRGYQANARVITTSDSFLEELVNLAR